MHGPNSYIDSRQLESSGMAIAGQIIIRPPVWETRSKTVNRRLEMITISTSHNRIRGLPVKVIKPSDIIIYVASLGLVRHKYYFISECQLFL